MAKPLESRLDQNQLQQQLQKRPKWDMLKNDAARKQEKKLLYQSIEEHDQEKEEHNKEHKEIKKSLSKVVKDEIRKGAHINEEVINAEVEKYRIESIDKAIQHRESRENVGISLETLHEVQAKTIQVGKYEAELREQIESGNGGRIERARQKAHLRKVTAWRTMYERRGQEIQKRIDSLDQEFSNQVNHFKYQMDIESQPVTKDDDLKDYRLPSDFSEWTPGQMDMLSQWHQDWRTKRAEERGAKFECDKADVGLSKLEQKKKMAEKLWKDYLESWRQGIEEDTNNALKILSDFRSNFKEENGGLTIEGAINSKKQERDNLYAAYTNIRDQLKDLQGHPVAQLVGAKGGETALYTDHLPWPDKNADTLTRKSEAIRREVDMVDKIGRLQKPKLEIPESSWRSWRGPKQTIFFPLKLAYGLVKDVSNYSKLEFHRMTTRYKKYKEQKYINNQLMENLDGRRDFNIDNAVADKVAIEEFAKQKRALKEKDYERRVNNLEEGLNRRDSLAKAVGRIEYKINKARDNENNYNRDSLYNSWYKTKKIGYIMYQQYLNTRLGLVDRGIEKEEKNLAQKGQDLGYKTDSSTYGGPYNGLDYTPRGRFLKAFQVSELQWKTYNTNPKAFEQWQADMRRCRRHEREVLFERERLNRKIQRLEGSLSKLEDLIQEKEKAQGPQSDLEDRALADTISEQIKEYNDNVAELNEHITTKIKDRYNTLVNGNPNAQLMEAVLGASMKKRTDAPPPPQYTPDTSQPPQYPVASENKSSSYDSWKRNNNQNIRGSSTGFPNFYDIEDGLMGILEQLASAQS